MKKLFSTLAISLLLSATLANAAEVMDIVKKAVHASYYQGKDEKAQIDMHIIDKQGRERTRRLTMLRRNLTEGYGAQKYYVFFSKPSDVKKMVFMAWKNIDRDDDRWLYLPALDLVKRIAASDERTSFVGSHFFYEDVSGRNIDEDVHELVEENDEYYVIKSVPKNPGAVEFSSYKNWVDKKTFLLMKAEYTNANGIVYRTYSVLKVEAIDGFPTVVGSEMIDNLTGGKTVIAFSNIKYNLGLPENIFTERYLRKPARKYLR